MLLHRKNRSADLDLRNPFDRHAPPLGTLAPHGGQEGPTLSVREIIPNRNEFMDRQKVMIGRIERLTRTRNPLADAEAAHKATGSTVAPLVEPNGKKSAVCRAETLDRFVARNSCLHVENPYRCYFGGVRPVASHSRSIAYFASVASE